jgi:hypothetical protein
MIGACVLASCIFQPVTEAWDLWHFKKLTRSGVAGLAWNTHFWYLVKNCNLGIDGLTDLETCCKMV